jgi:hypothetical protein
VKLLALGFMPARRTPEQYAAVAAAGDPPRSDEPRFVGNEDAWQDAQDEWHEKLREALCQDELPPRGIIDRRKAWQAAIKQAASFSKKLANDPTLAAPPDDDAPNRNQRRTVQRRAHKEEQRQQRTALEHWRLKREMETKPFHICTLFAFSEDECSRYDFSARIGVSPEGIIVVSTHDHRSPAKLHVLSPAGVRQNVFSVHEFQTTSGIACSSSAIFVSGSSRRFLIHKYGYDGNLLCSSTHAAGSGGLLSFGDFVYGYPNVTSPGHVSIFNVDLQLVSKFSNVDTDGKVEGVYSLTAHGSELFMSSTDSQCIKVLTLDGKFLRQVHLEYVWPTPVVGFDLQLPSPDERKKCFLMPRRPLMIAQSMEDGPVFVTLPTHLAEDNPPYVDYTHVCTHALDGRALHKIRFASMPHDAQAIGSRIYATTREGEYPGDQVANGYLYDLPAAELVNGVRVIDLQF